ncbi:hypothetical protein PBY51_004479 [Eleginops maclovinus]|uniref:Uncharacterized protein n=1 Tax=Eleginops maclovinus TaxID=56733 RepID=A0AAN7Y424_ELEMC|nr:hypothetical protein PBY51_004479 [Eleginops maclovinus]
MEETTKGNAEGLFMIFGQGEEDKEREETFSASMADASLTGREHPELNAAIHTPASQRVALKHTNTHQESANLPPRRLPRVWPGPSRHSRSQPEDTAA